jgi:hypothetical protein
MPPRTLERADRRVIFMLDEHIRADAGRESRPRVLGRRRHCGSHDRQCGFNLGEGEQGRGHDETLRSFIFHREMQKCYRGEPNESNKVLRL